MPNTFGTGETLAGAFERLWFGLVQFIPEIILALIIFLVGWAVGAVLGQVVERLVNSTGVNNKLKKTKADDMASRADYRLDAGRILGTIVKWFFIIVFLIAAFDVLGLARIAIFLQAIAFGFIPSLLVAIAILLFAGVIAEFVSEMVSSSAKSMGLGGSAKIISAATRALIWLFAVMAALAVIGIAETLVATLFAAIVFGIALALALAFGLGGREKAKQYLEKADKKAKQKAQKVKQQKSQGKGGQAGGGSNQMRR